MRDLSRLRDELDHWQRARQRTADALELVALDDPSLRPELEREVDDLEHDLHQLEFATLLAGEYDHESAIFTIFSGAGGTEAQDWVAMLQRMYLRWMEDHHYKVEIIDSSPGEEAGLKSVTMTVDGPHAYGYLQAEKGTHRLVRLSPFDSAHRRHTSFASVEVYPQVEDVREIDIKPTDIEIETYRASSAGGQNVQKNATAVRLTHLPSGLVVTCQDERSLTQNRLRAMSILRARLYEAEELKRQQAEAADRKAQIGTGERSEKIRTYNFPQSRVTDHRIGVSSFNLAGVLDGEIEVFIEELVARAQAEKLGGAGLAPVAADDED